MSRRVGVRRQATLVLVVSLVAPAIGLAIALWLVPTSFGTVNPGPVPLTVPVTSVTDAQVQPVVAHLAWVAGPVLRAPAWSGTVTAVDVKPGSQITTGSVIAEVNGVKRVAVRSKTPFYRPIGPGVNGPDVGALRHALAALGVGDVGTGDAYDPRLASAIRSLAERVTGESSAVAPPVFDPSWFIWLPQPQVRVQAVKLVVDEPAPPPGVPIIVSPSKISSATITAGTGPAGLSAPLPQETKGYSVSLGSAPTYPLGSTFTITSGSFLARLEELVKAPDAILSGTLQRVRPRRFASVPASAVVVDALGRTCVFVPTAHGFASVRVTTRAGLPGTAELSGLPSLDKAVLANPASTLPARGCA